MISELMGFYRQKELCSRNGEVGMKIIPEITILNGCCVKYCSERNGYAEIVSHSPRKIAKQWEEQGASLIHLRDADGILSGHIENEEAVKRVIEHVNIPVEVIGGFHSLKDIETMLNLGAERVVIRANELLSSNYIKEILQNFGPNKIVFSILAKNGMIMTDKWTNMKNYSAVSIIEELAESGIQHIEYENVSVSDVLFGLDTDYIHTITKRKGVDLTLLGGINTLKDLELIHGKDISGVILNETLYDNRIELKQAIELFE